MDNYQIHEVYKNANFFMLLKILLEDFPRRIPLKYFWVCFINVLKQNNVFKGQLLCLPLIQNKIAIRYHPPTFSHKKLSSRKQKYVTSL